MITELENECAEAHFAWAKACLMLRSDPKEALGLLRSAAEGFEKCRFIGEQAECERWILTLSNGGTEEPGCPEVRSRVEWNRGYIEVQGSFLSQRFSKGSHIRNLEIPVVRENSRVGYRDLGSLNAYLRTSHKPHQERIAFDVVLLRAQQIKSLIHLIAQHPVTLLRLDACILIFAQRESAGRLGPDKMDVLCRVGGSARSVEVLAEQVSFIGLLSEIERLIDEMEQARGRYDVAADADKLALWMSSLRVIAGQVLMRESIDTLTGALPVAGKNEEG